MFETPEIPTTPHQQAVRKVNRRKKIADLLEKVAEVGLLYIIHTVRYCDRFAYRVIFVPKFNQLMYVMLSSHSDFVANGIEKYSSSSWLMVHTL